MFTVRLDAFTFLFLFNVYRYYTAFFLSVVLYVCLCVCLPVYASICLSLFFSTSLVSASLSFGLPVSLPFYRIVGTITVIFHALKEKRRITITSSSNDISGKIYTYLSTWTILLRYSLHVLKRLRMFWRPRWAPSFIKARISLCIIVYMFSLPRNLA